MKKISLIIDEKKIEVEEGITILEAAKCAGIKIPHLCYREDLVSIGSCRICVVEVEGSSNLVASCSHPVQEGMVVKTDTPRIQKARRVNLELILSEHPLDCPVCDKGGECELQDVTYELGYLDIATPYLQGVKPDHKVDLSNPFFERNYNRCILCGRCVTVCNEVLRNCAIDFLEKGFKTKVGAPSDALLQNSPCVFCGQCVEVCPVGALLPKKNRFKAREWDITKVKTICSYCGVGCQLELNVKNNEIIKVTSPPDGTVNKGALCVKGRFGYDYVHHPERLTHPLIKRNGKLEKASWDEALDLVSTKLGEIKEKYGPDTISFFSSAKCTNEENYLMQKFARAVIGTNSVDHCARL
jgi:predicted molibdopterin-dependent oxidoreductase YjgC